MTPQTPQTPQEVSIKQKLADLEAALLSQDPLMKQHLKEIHAMLIKYEELVHLLSEDEIGKIVQGQQIITQTTLVAAVTGKGAKTAAGKKAATLSLGDL
jgi:hypothetical protein